MKYSIVIVAYKAEEYLRKCLKSIKESQIQDAEIIVVDNSPEPIFGDDKEPANCRLPFRCVRPPENLGFAGGCNLGAKLAGGEILIFANPDTEVYDDWADRLADRLVDGVVAVGPMASGFVSGYQKACFYGVTSMGRTAFDECREKFKGQTMVGVKVLIGYFLMIPKAVFDDVGGMDPGCFLGSDDLDLSLRLRDKYGEECLAVAKDVCVMHDGHRSFASRPSKEVEALIKESEDHVREKLYARYGGKPPSAEEIWGAEFWNTERPRPMTLCVCMIVKNETKNLKRLLPQLWFADEIVIVDTSEDCSTILDFYKIKDLLDNPLYKNPNYHEINKGFVWSDDWLDATITGKTNPERRIQTAYWFKFPWTNDFSEARNFALSKTNECRAFPSEWILWLDADDRIPEETGKLIRAALDNPGWKTWNRRCAFEFVVKNTNEEDSDPRAFQFHQMRMFPNLKGVAWRNKVHENALNSLMDLGMEFVPVDNIVIHHTGYSDPEILKAKHKRNMAILETEPDSPGKRFNIGNSHGTVNDWALAEAEYKAVLETKWPQALDPGFVDHVRFMVAVSLFHQGKVEEAAPYLNENKKPDSVHLLGEWHLKNGNHDAAFIAFREYLRLTERPSWDPWMSFRKLMRGQAYAHLIDILSAVTEESIAGAEKEYPGLMQSVGVGADDTRDVRE